MELSQPALGLTRLCFEHPTFRLRGERSYPLCHRRGFKVWLIRGNIVFLLLILLVRLSNLKHVTVSRL